MKLSAALLAFACLASPVRAAPPQAGAAPARTVVPTVSPFHSDAAAPRVPLAQEVDAGSRNVAARARMLECGHQWSNMKRAGTAAGGTWKDFSRGCLGQK